MKMKSVECFTMFSAIRLHFISNYDYFKYNGKVRVGDFSARKDKFRYQKLCEIVSEDDMELYIASNFVRNPLGKSLWIGALTSNEAENNFRECQKFLQSGTYIFRTEVEKLLNINDPQSIFKVFSNEVPEFIQSHLREEISIETFTILCAVMNLHSYYNKKLKDDYLWAALSKRTLKYRPFLKVENEVFDVILKEILSL